MKTPDAKTSQIKLALNRKEAAAALGISTMTLDRLARRKLLIPSRVTRRPLYPIAELNRFLTESSGNRFLGKSLSRSAGASAPLSQRATQQKRKETAWSETGARLPQSITGQKCGQSANLCPPKI